MADTPMPATKAKYGSYGGVFTQLFARAVAPDPVETHLAISTHDVVSADPPSSSYPPLDAIDAMLITGSRHSAFTDDAWVLALVEYTRRAVESGRVRVVGVCFGHQIVGRALGVPVAVNEKGWEVSVTEVRLSSRGREVFGLEMLVSTVLLLSLFPGIIGGKGRGIRLFFYLTLFNLI
jgi:GMP synthase (glutamine-hydrolysing)